MNHQTTLSKLHACEVELWSELQRSLEPSRKDHWLFADPFLTGTIGAMEFTADLRYLVVAYLNQCWVSFIPLAGSQDELVRLPEGCSHHGSKLLQSGSGMKLFRFGEACFCFEFNKEAYIGNRAAPDERFLCLDDEAEKTVTFAKETIVLSENGLKRRFPYSWNIFEHGAELFGDILVMHKGGALLEFIKLEDPLFTTKRIPSSKGKHRSLLKIDSCRVLACSYEENSDESCLYLFDVNSRKLISEFVLAEFSVQGALKATPEETFPSVIVVTSSDASAFLRINEDYSVDMIGVFEGSIRCIQPIGSFGRFCFAYEKDNTFVGLGEVELGAAYLTFEINMRRARPWVYANRGRHLPRIQGLRGHPERLQISSVSEGNVRSAFNLCIPDLLVEESCQTVLPDRLQTFFDMPSVDGDYILDTYRDGRIKKFGIPGGHLMNSSTYEFRLGRAYYADVSRILVNAPDRNEILLLDAQDLNIISSMQHTLASDVVVSEERDIVCIYDFKNVTVYSLDDGSLLTQRNLGYCSIKRAENNLLLIETPEYFIKWDWRFDRVVGRFRNKSLSQCLTTAYIASESPKLMAYEDNHRLMFCSAEDGEFMGLLDPPPDHQFVCWTRNSGFLRMYPQFQDPCLASPESNLKAIARFFVAKNTFCFLLEPDEDGDQFFYSPDSDYLSVSMTDPASGVARLADPADVRVQQFLTQHCRRDIVSAALFYPERYHEIKSSKTIEVGAMLASSPSMLMGPNSRD